jgi:membrane-associated phospholipid phosphatase
MDREALAVARLDRVIWAIIALVAAAVIAASMASNFQLAWDTFAPPSLACSILIAGGSFYSRWRTDPRLASALFSTAQLIAFAAVGAPLSYIAASANLPLHDSALAAADRALGLDWKALLAWMNAAPVIYGVLRPIYLSLTLQMTIVVLCLAFAGRILWLRTYMLAFCFAVLVCIAVSVVLPAAGAWPYFGITEQESAILPAVSTSWPVFYGLRDGSFRLLVAVGSEGIITFPSLHAALAVIVTAALWPVRWLRWLVLFLNAAMLAATPIDGSHYFTDVFAGVGLAVLSLLLAHAVAARVISASRVQAGQIASAPLAS